MKNHSYLLICLLSLLQSSCESQTSQAEPKFNMVSDEAKKYWYDGKAEINSYDLEQVRYGKIRQGKAVLIFVTEPFSKVNYTKADQSAADNLSVLKCNSTKSFLTGIYPYQMMTSSFIPFEKPNTSLKVTSSIQEWCGQTYMHLVNKKGTFEIDYNSYFQHESFQKKNMKDALLEDDIFSIIRLDHKSIKHGTHKMIPSFFYLALKHKDVKSYEAVISIVDHDSTTKNLSIAYPALKRTVQVRYENKFPFTILNWVESYPENGQMMTTKASLIRSMQSDYWNKSQPQDTILRQNLGL